MISSEIKTEWLAALRSNKYTQGKNYLFNDSADKYCCLGVLGVCLKLPLDQLRNQHFLGTQYLDKKTQRELSKMNDGGYSFFQIAKYIEDNVQC